MLINTLISLNADLASSIALRYACRLMELTQMRVQPIHVEEVDKEGYPPGSGWVRSTWERGLQQTAREELLQLIKAEKSSCQALESSIVQVGDRDDLVLKEMEEHPYDLLIEGVLNSFDTQLFQKKVRSKLYRYAPCPILLVKNLANPDPMALMIQEMGDIDSVVSNFQKLFEESDITLDLIHYGATKRHQEPLHMKLENGPPPDGEEAVAEAFAKARALLEKHGRTVRESWIIRDEAKKIGEMLGAYGLVCARVPRIAQKKSLALDVLSRVPSATLLCK